MIKNLLKNFFTNLVYVFVPMGIFYLFLIFGIITFASSFLNSTATFIDSSIAQVSSLGEQASDTVSNFFNDAVSSINFNDDFGSIFNQIFQTDFLNETIDNFLKLIQNNYSSAYDSILTLSQTYQNEIVVAASIFAGIIVIALYLSSFACNFFVKRKVAKTSLFRKILSYGVDAIIKVVVMVIVAFLTFLWSSSVYIAAIFFLLISGFSTLASAYYQQRDKTLKFKEVVTLKNVLSFYAADAILLVVICALIFLISIVLGSLFSFLLLLPVLIYTFSNISYSAESYVASLREKPAKA